MTDPPTSNGTSGGSSRSSLKRLSCSDERLDLLRFDGDEARRSAGDPRGAIGDPVGEAGSESADALEIAAGLSVAERGSLASRASRKATGRSSISIRWKAPWRRWSTW